MEIQHNIRFFLGTSDDTMNFCFRHHDVGFCTCTSSKSIHHSKFPTKNRLEIHPFPTGKSANLPAFPASHKSRHGCWKAYQVDQMLTGQRIPSLNLTLRPWKYAIPKTKGVCFPTASIFRCKLAVSFRGLVVNVHQWQAGSNLTMCLFWLENPIAPLNIHQEPPNHPSLLGAANTPRNQHTSGQNFENKWQAMQSSKNWLVRLFRHPCNKMHTSRMGGSSFCGFHSENSK